MIPSPRLEQRRPGPDMDDRLPSHLHPVLRRVLRHRGIVDQ